MMAKIRICREEGCHNSATTQGFCRLHYLRNWKRLKDEAHKRAAKKLNKYIEGVIKSHPERYMEVIKKDIRSPDFQRKMEEKFGYEDEDSSGIFNEPTCEEEIEQLLKQLKVEKGY